MTQESTNRTPENPFNRLFDSDKGLKNAQVWVCAFLIAIAALIVYSNSFSIPFTGPDRELVEQGIQTSGTAPLLESGDTPRMLPLATLALNAWLQPSGTAGFRAASLAFHVVASLMVFFLCRRLFRKRLPEPASMLAGMLFALHPVATESLHLLEHRGGLMSVSLALCALVAALRVLDPRVSGGIMASAPALGLYALAWASGPAALLFPPMILAADWVAHGRRELRRRAGFHAAVWLLTVFMVAVEWSAGDMGAFSLAAMPGPALYLLRIMGTATGLSVVHPATAGAGMLDWAVVAVCAVAGLALLARRSVLGFAALWVALSLLIMPMVPLAAGERALYPVLAGAALAGPWLLRVLRWTPLVRLAAGVAAGMLVLAAGLGTFLRNSDWNDPVTLYTEAEAVAPDAAEVHRRLGELYLEQGRVAMTLAASAADQTSASLDRDRALSLMAAAGDYLGRVAAADPEAVQPRVAWATSLAARGETDEAYRVLLEALRMSPENVGATIELARLHTMRAMGGGGREDLFEAVTLFERAMESGPVPVMIMTEYAAALMGLGDIERAAAVLDQVGARDEASPLHPQYRQAIEAARQVQGIETQAQTLAARGAALPDQLAMRAQALVLRGNRLHAAYLLEEALRRNAGHLDSWTILGMIRGMEGDAERFLREHPAPVTMAVGQTSPFVELARVCLASNLPDLARTYIEHPSAKAGLPEPPLVSLALAAGDLGMGDYAMGLLREATEAYPDDPAAHLRMAAAALAGRDAVSALGYLDEAARRGADDAALGPLREQLERLQAESAGQAPVTILR